MRRLLKSWVFWAFVALPPVAALLAFARDVDRDYVCTECWIGREIRQWRLCPMGRNLFPLLPPREVVGKPPNPLLPPHEHLWRLQWVTWRTILGSQDPEAGP